MREGLNHQNISRPALNARPNDQSAGSAPKKALHLSRRPIPTPFGKCQCVPRQRQFGELNENVGWIENAMIEDLLLTSLCSFTEQVNRTDLRRRH